MAVCDERHTEFKTKQAVHKHLWFDLNIVSKFFFNISLYECRLLNQQRQVSIPYNI